ncbi:hypothetical protein SAMN04487983_103215 [Streptomyces sp. yr375]|uniref:hypothetical protein n=1 Tax=Streptomyces sp. yr375 TaxID=1761906 RepID=UPI0008CAD652|nr:hypothetical protein [Streptomyces sp. yr375]SES12467.1 hypothetical protein SAMN04487983_103215 [Streptomyces sp. yr375]
MLTTRRDMCRALIRRPASGGRPGWWCECVARTTDGDGDGEVWTVRVRMGAADTPERALVWMRLAVRVLLSALDPEDVERTFRWLDHGQWEAVMRLRAGEPYVFVAASGSTRVEWSARPVLFLPLLPRRG